MLLHKLRCGLTHPLWLFRHFKTVEHLKHVDFDRLKKKKTFLINMAEYTFCCGLFSQRGVYETFCMLVQHEFEKRQDDLECMCSFLSASPQDYFRVILSVQTFMNVQTRSVSLAYHPLHVVMTYLLWLSAVFVVAS